MPLTIDLNPPAMYAEFAASIDNRVFDQNFDALASRILSISAGSGSYPLRSSLTASYYPSIGELHVERASPLFIGQGCDREHALADFELKVHSRVQDLIWKRPFELSAIDSRDLEVLDGIIDIAVYKNTTPILVRQFGVIKYDRTSIPRAIEWENGYTEHLKLNQVASPEFVNYPPGQPVEAWVMRDPITRELLFISNIVKVSRMRTEREIEESGFWARIGSVSDLPDGEW